MIKKVCLWAMLFFAPMLANAVVLTSSAGGGMIATNEWDNGGASLEGTATQSGENWVYDYTWVGAIKDLSHIIIEVSPTFAWNNILAGTTAGWSLGTFGDEGGSNPGILDTIYGLKWDVGQIVAGVFEFSIVTDRAPMWGDFYAKDGQTAGGGPVYAYNASFGQDPGVPYGGTVPYGYMVVPDTGTTNVPEPSVLALFGLGLFSFGMMKKVKRE